MNKDRSPPAFPWRARRRGKQRNQAYPRRPPRSGQPSGENRVLLMDFPLVRLRRLRGQEARVLFDPRPSDRLIESRGLQGVQLRKVVAAITIILELLHSPDFER